MARKGELDRQRIFGVEPLHQHLARLFAGQRADALTDEADVVAFAVTGAERAVGVGDRIAVTDADADGRRVDDLAQLLFGAVERGLGGAAQAPFMIFAQLAAHRRGQPRDLFFDDDVVDAGGHELDGARLTDGAGEDQERHILAVGANARQHGERVAVGQSIVAQDEIPGATEDAVLKVGHPRDDVQLGLDATDAQRAPRELDVLRAILDEEDAQRLDHGCEESTKLVTLTQYWRRQFRGRTRKKIAL